MSNVLPIFQKEFTCISAGLIFDTGKKKECMYPAYQTCIDACMHCVSACRRCVASCLAEGHAEHMATCIQLDLECEAICEATARILTLGSNYANTICQICADICEACATECEKHDMDHCQACADACRLCAAECLGMVAA